MMKLHSPPSAILDAAAGLLRPFAPELTATTLARALRQFSATPGSEAPAVGKSVTIAEFCRRVDCSRSTAHRLRKAGRLRAFRFGPNGGVRIPEAEVQRLIGLNVADRAGEGVV